jgi:type IX secretion system PorP/SprF family membrane protein
MKKIVILIWAIVFALELNAQQLSLQSEMYFTRLTANPALTAYNGSTNVYGFFRDQWSGALTHPRVAGGIGEISLWNDRIGTGLEVSAYTGGISQMIDAKVYYAQKIKLAEGQRLSLGVMAGIVQRGTTISPDDRDVIGDDPNLNIPKAMLFDMNIGVAYQWKKLTLGFAIPNLLDANTRSYSNQYKITDWRRNYLFNGSYEVNLADEKFNLEPGFILKINQLRQVNFNLQVMANYKRIFYLGLGYNLYSGMPVTAGLKISKIFTLAYTYQVPLMNNVPTQGIYSTHELTVGVCFHKWMKKNGKTNDSTMAVPAQKQ